MLKVAALLLLAQVVDSPASAVMIARDDLGRLPIEVHTQMLYMSLYNVPTEARPEFVAVLSGHCNQLSRRTKLAPVTVLNKDLSMVRVDMRAYGWTRATVIKLLDPRFYAEIEEFVEKTVTVPWEGGTWSGDGKKYPKGSFEVKRVIKEKVKKSNGTAPWLSDTPEHKKAVVDLLFMGGDYLPVCTALYFVNQTVTQQGRTPGYYEMLGIKNQKDFEKLARFNEETAADLEHRRSIVISGITQEPRAVEATRTVIGPFWRTFDQFKGAAVGANNPLRTLRKSEFKSAVTEQIASLPNEWPVYYLGNNKGDRADKAPDNVVKGDRTGVNTPELLVNISCVRCHFEAKGESGIKDMDWAVINKFASLDYDVLEELESQYKRDIEPQIAASRVSFETAIFRTTGLASHKYAAGLARYYSMLEDARVDLEFAARDMGYTKEDLLKRWESYHNQQPLGLDPVLTIIKGGGRIPITQWHEAMSLAHTAAQGLP